MAINLAEKYSTQVDEVIRKGLLSTAGTNNDVEFEGAQTVKVYSLDTAPLNDYDPEGGMSRYGTPVELEDTVQTMKMTQQKSFTFTIDKTYESDSPEGVRNAGKALQRQIEQVIIPAIDTYRFSVLASKAGTVIERELDSTNAYNTFVEANTAITDEEFPIEGRVAFCSNAFIELLKKDSGFTKATELAQERVIYKGMVGDCDGVAIIAVPKRRLPEDTAFIITHPMCAPAPVKLQDYKIHKDPPGIAGTLVEGLLYHDIFVFDKKKKAVAVCFDRAASAQTDSNE
ncbi:MAG: N4-gp56 family major capsid protein [Ruminiclostridium sp.]|nr:N4-gp56 family major capsid protein [Ruminiclostridium sp.]